MEDLNGKVDEYNFINNFINDFKCGKELIIVVYKFDVSDSSDSLLDEELYYWCFIFLVFIMIGGFCRSKCIMVGRYGNIYYLLWGVL